MKARRLGYNTDCLTCELPIERTERAVIEQGIGAWHEDCGAPLNLPIYRRERDRGKHRRGYREYTPVDDVS